MGVRSGAGAAGRGAGGPETCRRHGAGGFTLIELLVVIGVIAILVGLLLPVFARVQAAANEVRCASQVRQIVQSLHLYAMSNQGKFPENVDTPAPARYWYDPERIGPYLKDNGPPEAIDPVTKKIRGGVKGGILVCPADEGSWRSYAMNLWASGHMDSRFHRAPYKDRRWSSKTGPAASLILVAEAWSSRQSPQAGTWMADPYVGNRGDRPQARFGRLTPYGIAPRFSGLTSELPFYRHRRGRGRVAQPIGRVNLGYLDGHVAARAHDDLLNPYTGLGTGDSWWSPADPELNRE